MTLEVIPRGSLVNIANSDAFVEAPRWHYKTATIEDYVSSEDSEDGKAFYIASAGTDNYSNVMLWPEHITVEKTVAEMDAREIPTAAAILDAISSSLLDGYNGFEIDETFKSPSDLEVYGETDDGLRFGFTLVITDLSQTSF